MPPFKLCVGCRDGTVCFRDFEDLSAQWSWRYFEDETSFRSAGMRLLRFCRSLPFQQVAPYGYSLLHRFARRGDAPALEASLDGSESCASACLALDSLGRNPV